MSSTMFLIPSGLDGTLDALAEHGEDVTVLAGGTQVMAGINLRLLRPEVVVSLAHAGISGVTWGRTEAVIGATTTVESLLRDPVVSATYPALRAAAGLLGSWPIRNVATVGGNLFAAPPSGDLVPALLAYDAAAALARRGGSRVVKLHEFFRGYGTTVAQPGELLTEIHMPAPPADPSIRVRASYYKLGRRRHDSPAIVSVAVYTEVDRDGVLRRVRIAAGNVAAYPMRFHDAERLLQGHQLTATLEQALQHEIDKAMDPMDDAHGTAWYRRKVTPRLVWRLLQACAAEASPDD